MIDKYYTPIIEEFHVGFICEMNTTQNEWVEVSISLNHFTHLKKWLEEGHIRVRYLDTEDLQDFGFKFRQFIPIRDTSNYMGEKVETLTSSKIFLLNKEITICDIKYDGMVLAKYRGTPSYVLAVFNNYTKETVFSGDIKNKSELSKLLKQLKTL